MRERRSAWAATHTGRIRSSNEDSWCVGTLTNSEPECEWCGTLTQSAPWAIVADGMGGHEAGEVASRLALASLIKDLPNCVSEDAISSAILRANDLIFEEMYVAPGRLRMGSTIVGILVNGAGAFLFNVGDSRAYVQRSGKLTQKSVDHTLASAGARVRSHALTQSLGGAVARLPLIPCVKKLALDADELVLLCSDGVTDMLSDEEIAAVLRSAPPQPARALVDAALDAGGDDNATAVIIGPARVSTS